MYDIENEFWSKPADKFFLFCINAEILKNKKIDSFLYPCYKINFFYSFSSLARECHPHFQFDRGSKFGDCSLVAQLWVYPFQLAEIQLSNFPST